VAAYAFGFVGTHEPGVLIEAVHFVGALPLADTAGNAPVLVTDDFKLGIEIIYRHFRPSSFRTAITGSPPIGDQIQSTSLSIARIAHSSLAR
jgi:hypothetical protein